MRFNKLDLNLLVALDAMLAERSISRAAQRMHMSQSAMSNALSRLRDYFKDELLVQVGRRMDLTPRAEVLQEIVRDILVRIDAAVLTSPVFDFSESEREFTLFVSDYTLQTIMPHVLALAKKHSPKVRFSLLPQVADPDRALDRGEADLLVIPEGYCSAEHPTEIIFQETMSCVVWRESRWAHDPLTADAYQAAEHIAVVPGREKSAFDTTMLQTQFGIERKVEVASFSFSSAPFLVLQTDRIATVHSRLAHQAARLLPIEVLPMPIAVPVMNQLMQWHKHRSYDPGILWLRQMIHESAVLMDGAHIARM